MADRRLDRQPNERGIELDATVQSRSTRVSGSAIGLTPETDAPHDLPTPVLSDQKDVSPVDRRNCVNGLLRWKYIIPRALVVALIWAFFAFGFDPLLRYGIVSGGASLIGAKVDVEQLQTRFFPPMLVVNNVGITDPRRTDENAFTFDELRIRIAGEPLLHREVVIEDAVIDGLQVNADRLSDGTLDESESSTGSGFDLGPLTREIELVGLQWYDQLESLAKKQLDPQSLETVVVAQTVEDEWKLRIDDTRARIDELQRRIDAVREVAQTKGDPLDQLDAYSQATKEVQSILQESQRIRDDVQELPAIARRDVARIDQARQNDTARLKQRLHSLPLDPSELTRSLLGPELARRLTALNNWIAWTRRYFSADAVETLVPSTRGEWIDFPRTHPRPAFVLEHLAVTGEATSNGRPFALHGTCRGITSDAALYGKPAEWRFEMSGPDPLTIAGRSDLRTEVPLHEVAFDWRANRPIRQVIGDHRKIAVAIHTDSALCDGWLRLAGEQLEGQLHLRQNPVSITISESSDEFARCWIAPALSAVKSAEATLDVSGAIGDLDWQVQSDLGPQVQAGIQQLLLAEVDARRTQLMARVDTVARERMASLPDHVGKQTQYLLADLTSRESRAKQAIARLTDGKLDMHKVGRQLQFDGLFKR